MKKTILLWISFLCHFLLHSCTLDNPTPGTKLEGRLFYTTKSEPIANAKIVLLINDQRIETTTDENGNYKFKKMKINSDDVVVWYLEKTGLAVDTNSGENYLGYYSTTALGFEETETGNYSNYSYKLVNYGGTESPISKTIRKILKSGFTILPKISIGNFNKFNVGLRPTTSFYLKLRWHFPNNLSGNSYKYFTCNQIRTIPTNSAMNVRLINTGADVKIFHLPVGREIILDYSYSSSGTSGTNNYGRLSFYTQENSPVQEYELFLW
jgi:hypothetical protein